MKEETLIKEEIKPMRFRRYLVEPNTPSFSILEQYKRYLFENQNKMLVQVNNVITDIIIDAPSRTYEIKYRTYSFVPSTLKNHIKWFVRKLYNLSPNIQ